jgi:hypothetical protein
VQVIDNDLKQMVREGVKRQTALHGSLKTRVVQRHILEIVLLIIAHVLICYFLVGEVELFMDVVFDVVLLHGQVVD